MYNFLYRYKHIVHRKKMEVNPFFFFTIHYRIGGNYMQKNALVTHEIKVSLIFLITILTVLSYSVLLNSIPLGLSVSIFLTILFGIFVTGSPNALDVLRA